jgi:methionine-rich copper-binding protein CopC
MAGHRRGGVRRTAATGLAAAAAAAVVLLLGAPPAWAHSSLVSGSPSPGSAVTALPAVVRLTFDLPVLPDGAQVVVRGPDGVDLQAGAPRVTDTVVEVPVRPSSAPGRYQVGWQLVSADGFPAIGAYAFTLGAAASAGPTDAATAVEEVDGGLLFSGGGSDPGPAPPAAAGASRSDGSPRPVLLAAGAGVLGLLGVAVARRRRAGAASTLAG